MVDEFDVEEEEFEEKVGLYITDPKEALALCVGVYKGGPRELPLCQEHLRELHALADTFGCTVQRTVALPLRTIDPSTLLTKGKLQEVKELVEAEGVNLVIFDEEITPSQQRNLEKALKVAVMDRTELIIEIFAQRALTKEAKLQVELARIKYEFPRLKRLWSHFSRQRHSGGYLKGEGETQLEIDKRLLKKKVKRLKEELEEVKKVRATQRQQRLRSDIPTFAIVGYTNAGKSTLLNALTQSEVFVEDKLFATLDPTTRKCTLPNHSQILLTDTVGFIRKLPHLLVAAFRSTLEAALQDDVILHVVDVSHPLCVEQAEVTRTLMQELNANENAVITLLNKSDICTNKEILAQLQVTYPKTVLISAKERQGFEKLFQMMEQTLESKRVRIKLRIPQSRYDLVAILRERASILEQEYEENDIILWVDLSKNDLYLFEKFEIKENIVS